LKVFIPLSKIFYVQKSAYFSENHEHKKYVVENLEEDI